MKRFAKIRNNGGFSLVELLVAIIILGLVGTVVAGGVPAAVGAYKKVVEKANAQLLLTTTTNALRNELDTASNISEGDEGTSLSFINSRNYNLKIKSAADGIKVEYVEEGSSDPVSYLLVSEAAASGNLRVVFADVDYDAATGTITITDMKVLNNENKQLASLGTYTINVLR